MNQKKAYNSDRSAPRMNLSRIILHACVAYIMDEADETTDSSFSPTNSRYVVDDECGQPDFKVLQLNL
jgi:hypothetical protein